METKTALHRYWDLTRDRQMLEAKLEEIKARLTETQQEILDQFARDGVSSVKVTDGNEDATIYLHKQMWARPKDGDYVATCFALRRNGLSSFVKETVNLQTLSAYVREQEKEGQPLPSDVAETLDVRTEYAVRVRKA